MGYFIDQRYPDERISSSQLWKEYWEQVGRGEINPEEYPSLYTFQLHGIRRRHPELCAGSEKEDE